MKLLKPVAERPKDKITILKDYLTFAETLDIMKTDKIKDLVFNIHLVSFKQTH